MLHSTTMLKTRWMARWGANVGELTIGGQWWRLFTCVFLHIGAIHLVFNMVVLWSIGRVLERLAGRGGFAVIYLLSGLCGSMASIWWNPNVVSAGASGAIFGLYGALLGFLARESHCLPQAVRKRLALNAVAFVGYNLLFALGKNGIDVAAHLGGLVAGFACGFGMALPETREVLHRRFRSNALFLAGGLLFLGLLAILIPKQTGLSGLFAQAGQVEMKALKAFEEGAAKVRSGASSDAQFAQTIEDEVIPGLREYRNLLEGIAETRGVNSRVVQAMVRYTEAREEAFALMAHAMRTGDQDEAARALKGQAQAADTFQEEVKKANE